MRYQIQNSAGKFIRNKLYGMGGGNGRREKNVGVESWELRV
jgi:hypothetical protein